MWIRCIIEGWPYTNDLCPEPICDYFTFRYELSVVDGLLLKGSNHSVIPNNSDLMP